jgi:P-type E1-E2 ATPase
MKVVCPHIPFMYSLLLWRCGPFLIGWNVLPGTKIPADGIVTWGSSYVNESMVTGESVPVLKEVNVSVIGDTINLHGVLHIKATKIGSDTVLSQIISLVETAQMSKAPIQKFADYVSNGFRPSCSTGVTFMLYLYVFLYRIQLHHSILWSWKF